MNTLSLRGEGPTSALPGDLAIWIFIFAEMGVFGVLFIVYAWARRSHLELFEAGQALLDRRIGLANTLIFISSSYAVARAAAAIRADRAAACRRWLLAALTAGAAFVVLKVGEFGLDAERGIGLSRNLFDMFYLSLTFFHFMHVLMGLVILAVVAWKTGRGAYSARSHSGVETAGAYWHMVDLVWIVLFALVYVLH
ncbi:MAG: cytochrome c oxidase subunit 3 [Burkholderiales bacterium]|nr:cytochrome c oxidase subunit 3 [Burkholderiales bacterium]